MADRIENNYGNITVVRRSDYEWGVINSKGEEIVPFGKYGWIEGFDNGLCRVRSHGKTGYTNNIKAIIDLKNDTYITDRSTIEEKERENRTKHPEQYAKWGIINERGEEVIPVEYDEIWKFFGKNRTTTKVIKGGTSRDVSLDSLRNLSPNTNANGYSSSLCNDYDDNYNDIDRYGGHYGEFAGTYAQDVAGYDDDTINDAFEGEPDAYWNID